MKLVKSVTTGPLGKVAISFRSPPNSLILAFEDLMAFVTTIAWFHLFNGQAKIL